MADFYLDSDIDDIISLLGPVARDFSGKTILMSGARGFLGRYFTAVFVRLNETTLEKPCKLIALDNLITAGAAGDMPETPNVEFYRHDVITPFVTDQPVDFVIQAAGIASPFYYRRYPLETLEVATTGTRLMLELAEQKDARFTFFSSSEIYGDPDGKYVPTPESYRGNVSCQGPRACYDESKRVGETLCYIFHETRGLATNTIRPFNVYGPGMQEADYRVLPNFASRIKGNKPLRVYGSGNQTRTYCYITDAINGFLRVIARGVPGEAYNIGNPKPEISVLELAQNLEKVLGRDLKCDVIDYPDSYPADEPNRRCPDIRKARLQLDYAPSVTLEDGLGRFLGWTDGVYTGEE
ncbi:MAG: NAD-dependent epimerase/dehydratase family protein [Rhodospirillales bacterium]